MRRVSFETAKALKEACYPQMDDYTYDLETKTLSLGFVSQNRFAAPTYLETWLWLWREKGIKIVAEPRQKVFVYIKADFYGLPKELASVFDDPEEAIIAAIKYLVENKLLK